MQQKTERKDAAWTAPRLNKLGKLEDVAPGPAGTKEGASGKS